MNSINLLNELIRIDSSVLENTNKAIEFSAEYLKQHGIDGKILENSGYKSYVATVGSGSKTLIINGHLDVVKYLVSKGRVAVLEIRLKDVFSLQGQPVDL